MSEPVPKSEDGVLLPDGIGPSSSLSSSSSTSGIGSGLTESNVLYVKLPEGHPVIGQSEEDEQLAENEEKP